jgi:hypothetical protein
MKNKFKGLFGEFSGRIGNLIVYELNGQTVIRTRPAGPQKKATGKRKQYQDDFRHVMKLMQIAKHTVKIGFAEEGKKGTGFKKALGENLKKYRSLDRPESLNWLELSRGTLSGAASFSSELLTDGQLKICWTGTEEGKPFYEDDQLLVLIVNETTLKSLILSHTYSRKDGHLVVQAPAQKDGECLRVFICFYQPEIFGKVSKPLISNSQTFLIE